MPRLLLTLAAAALIGLVGTSAGYGRTALSPIANPRIANPQVAQADKTTDKKTDGPAAKKKATRKRTRKAKRRYTYGKIYLTAYAKNGRQRKAGKFGSRLRLYAKATKSRKTKKGKRTAGRSEAVTYCGKSYYTTKRGTQWIATHEKAGHVLIVRQHTARKKFKVLCGERPKRVKRRTARKNSTTKKKTAKKVDKDS